MDKATIETTQAMAITSVTAPLRFESHIRAIIAAHDGVVHDANWGLEVTLMVSAPRAEITALELAIVERTSGTARVTSP